VLDDCRQKVRGNRDLQAQPLRCTLLIQASRRAGRGATAATKGGVRDWLQGPTMPVLSPLFPVAAGPYCNCFQPA